MGSQRTPTATGLRDGLVNLALLLTLVIVVLSAYLRLEASGLGCDDRAACYGMLSAAHAAQPSQGADQQGVRLLHRVTASLLGLCVLGLVAASLRPRARHRSSPLVPFLLLAFVVFLALLGYATPSPHIPAVTLGNLLGGMAMLALLGWMRWRRSPIHELIPASPGLRAAAWFGLALMATQIALGAWTSANFAGRACPSVLRCDTPISGAHLTAGFSLSRELAVDNGRIAVDDDIAKLIQLSHRGGAVLCLLWLGAVGVIVLRRGRPWARAAGVMLALLAAQALLGLALVASDLPLAVATLHNAVAAVLLLSIVFLLASLSPRPQP